MGRRAWRSRAGLWASMAFVAQSRWWRDRPDRECDRDDPPQPGFTSADRHRLEPGGRRQDGVAAVPLPVSVLCRQWTTLVSALPALRRRLSRRAVQYRILCAAHADGR